MPNTATPADAPDITTDTVRDMDAYELLGNLLDSTCYWNRSPRDDKGRLDDSGNEHLRRMNIITDELHRRLGTFDDEA